MQKLVFFGRLVTTLAGIVGATLAYLGTNPPQQVMGNLQDWANALGVPLRTEPSMDTNFHGEPGMDLGLLDIFQWTGVVLLVVCGLMLALMLRRRASRPNA